MRPSPRAPLQHSTTGDRQAARRCAGTAGEAWRVEPGGRRFTVGLDARQIAPTCLERETSLSGPRRSPCRTAGLWPDVIYAKADVLLEPQRTPNDWLYSSQWHYFEPAGGVRFPGAWDTTIGSSGITVAVIDTGLVAHANVAGRAVPGYDFRATLASPMTVTGGMRTRAIPAIGSLRQNRARVSSLAVPSKAAPGTGLTSPVQSPRRPTTRSASAELIGIEASAGYGAREVRRLPVRYC